ncbi:MAG: hypothetical protein ACEY3L_06095 [Wolbachia sp.]
MQSGSKLVLGAQLVERDKVHIKLGLMENFVKALDKDFPISVQQVELRESERK